MFSQTLPMVEPVASVVRSLRRTCIAGPCSATGYQPMSPLGCSHSPRNALKTRPRIVVPSYDKSVVTAGIEVPEPAHATMGERLLW